VNNKAVKRILLCQAALMLLSVSAMTVAQDNQGVENWTFTTSGAVPGATNLYTIYSNLGPTGQKYDPNQGDTIEGPKQGRYGQIWPAMPFTPKDDAEVTMIKIALANSVGGSNGNAVSLNEDSNGLPGKALHTWIFTNLPAFGTCCVLQVAKSAEGLNLTKGTQYWVVAFTNKNEANASDAWGLQYENVEGPVAFNRGSGWHKSRFYVGAFGVFGNKK
jgi:hypothetical protein